MKLPRDVSGPELVKALRVLGYVLDRQRGSHVRVTTQRDGEHHEAIPNHHPIKVGTLSGILKTRKRGLALGFGVEVDAERDQAADFSAAKKEAERDPLLIRGNL